MLLRDSSYKGNLTYGTVMELAQAAMGKDTEGYRHEFLGLVKKAKEMAR
jgi:Ca-activated chloride channel family protein